MVAARFSAAVLCGSAALASAFVTKVPHAATAWRSRIVTRAFSAKSEEKGGGHSVPDGAPVDEELNKIQERLMEHQRNAAKLTGAEEARTLVQYAQGFGVLSTNSQNALKGFPASAMVGFAVDNKGRPIFSFSSISTHKQDLVADPKASFMVAHKDFKGLDDGRVGLVGEIRKVPDDAVKEARETYLAKHPGHFWVDFGDFDFFRFDEIKALRYNGGFARFGNIEPYDYMEATPDPVSAYAEHVMGHMNADHSDATAQIVRHYVGIPVDKATMVMMDRLGMYVRIENKYGKSKVRVPFIRPADDRKALKEILVEMTNAPVASQQ